MQERLAKKARVQEDVEDQQRVGGEVVPEGRAGPEPLGHAAGQRRRGLAQELPRPKVAMLPIPEPRRRGLTPPAPGAATHAQDLVRAAAPATRAPSPQLQPSGLTGPQKQQQQQQQQWPSKPPLHPRPLHPCPALAPQTAPPVPPRPRQPPSRPPRRLPPPSPPCDGFEEGELPPEPNPQGPQPPAAIGPATSSTGATARLHMAALSGLLWHPECQQLQALQQQQRLQPPQLQQEAAAERVASGAQASTSAPQAGPGVLVQDRQHPHKQQQQQQQQVPNNFTSVNHYVSVFEPLLHEEARGALVNSFEEVSCREWLSPPEAPHSPQPSQFVLWRRRWLFICGAAHAVLPEGCRVCRLYLSRPAHPWGKKGEASP